jgi:hypothetical protein
LLGSFWIGSVRNAPRLLLCHTSLFLHRRPRGLIAAGRVRTERPAVDRCSRSLRARLSGSCVGGPDSGDASSNVRRAISSSGG